MIKFALFAIPYTLDYEIGDRSLHELIDWDLQIVEWADQFGWGHAFFAEHYTIGREPSPSPDLMIAAASQRTRQIRLGAAAHLLPYHHPVDLAHRLMYLDHMTGGRYTAGFAPGAFPTDAQLFGTTGKNREMSEEALEIIRKIWTEEAPFKYEGKFWSVDMPEYSEHWKGPHLRPHQRPHPPIAMTGAQPSSPTLAEAGRLGFIPISNGVSTEVLRAHWETYSGAAIEAGRTPNRADWIVQRYFFVADTDEEAFDLVVNGEMGRVFREHAVHNLRLMKVLEYLAPGVPPEEVTAEYMANNEWIVGSPETVAQKIAKLYRDLGGFGTLMTTTFDYRDNALAYRRCIELMGTKVGPRVAELLAEDSDDT